MISLTNWVGDNHIPQGYPGLIERDGTVHGEVYEFPGTEARDELDWLEGYNRNGDYNLYDSSSTVGGHFANVNAYLMRIL